MPTVKEDSEFGLATAKSIAEFQPCKDALAKAAQKLDNIIVKPILKKLQESSTPIYSPREKKTIKFLIKEHSKNGAQWGGCMQHLTSSEIEKNIENKVELFKKISSQLSVEVINNIKNEHDLAGTMKAITDCCYCYVEYFQSEERALTSDYETLKAKITPTPAELEMRITYTEVGGVPHVATDYGIERTDVQRMEKGNESSNLVRYGYSGKSVYVQTDLLARIGYVMLRYGFAEANYKRATKPGENQENINNLKEEFCKYQNLMNLLGIPLDVYERASQLGPYFMHHCIHAYSWAFFLGAGDVYKIHPSAAAPVPQTNRLEALDAIPKDKLPAIQKLVLSCARHGEELPLVASASGTTARTLIALQDMGVFTKGYGKVAVSAENANISTSSLNVFDVETAQYIAITLCGHLVHGGHHSVVEVGDIYNRLLEYHAEKQRFFSASTNLPNSPAANVYLDYIYTAGDYNSFVPKNMRNVEKLPVNIFLETQLSAKRVSPFKFM